MSSIPAGSPSLVPLTVTSEGEFQEVVSRKNKRRSRQSVSISFPTSTTPTDIADLSTHAYAQLVSPKAQLCEGENVAQPSIRYLHNLAAVSTGLSKTCSNLNKQLAGLYGQIQNAHNKLTKIMAKPNCTELKNIEHQIQEANGLIHTFNQLKKSFQSTLPVMIDVQKLFGTTLDESVQPKLTEQQLHAASIPVKSDVNFQKGRIETYSQKRTGIEDVRIAFETTQQEIEKNLKNIFEELSAIRNDIETKFFPPKSWYSSLFGSKTTTPETPAATTKAPATEKTEKTDKTEKSESTPTTEKPVTTEDKAPVAKAVKKSIDNLGLLPIAPFEPKQEKKVEETSEEKKTQEQEKSEEKKTEAVEGKTGLEKEEQIEKKKEATPEELKEMFENNTLAVILEHFNSTWPTLQLTEFEGTPSEPNLDTLQKTDAQARAHLSSFNDLKKNIDSLESKANSFKQSHKKHSANNNSYKNTLESNIKTLQESSEPIRTELKTQIEAFNALKKVQEQSVLTSLTAEEKKAVAIYNNLSIKKLSELMTQYDNGRQQLDDTIKKTSDLWIDVSQQLGEIHTDVTQLGDLKDTGRYNYKKYVLAKNSLSRVVGAGDTYLKPFEVPTNL